MQCQNVFFKMQGNPVNTSYFEAGSRVVILSGRMSPGGYVFLRMLIRNFPDTNFTIVTIDKLIKNYENYEISPLDNVSFIKISRFQLAMVPLISWFPEYSDHEFLYLNSFGYLIGPRSASGVKILFQNSLLIDEGFHRKIFQPSSLIKLFLFRLNVFLGRSFLVQTDKMKDRFLERFSHINVSVVQLATKILAARNSLPIKRFDSQSIHCIYPSVYLPHKNHKTLFRSLKYWRFNQEVTLYLTFSEAELTASDRALINSVNNVVVKFTGILEYHDYKELLSAQDFVVYPSNTESFGLPIYEALEMRLPVAYSKSILIDMDLPGDACQRFDSGDPESLARAVNNLIKGQFKQD